MEVWIERYRGDTSGWQWLSQEEQERAKAFRYERDRDAYIECHARLRHVLGQYLELPPEDLRFSLGPMGKPYLVTHPITFSLSHSYPLEGPGRERGGFAIALSRTGEVGIDLECSPKSPWQELARSVFTERELVSLAELPAVEQEAHFLRLWTAKEAFLKALGTGFQTPPDRIEILRSGKKTWDIATSWPGIRADEWKLHELSAPAGLVASLVTPADQSWKLATERSWKS